MATANTTTTGLFPAMEHLAACNPDLALFAHMIATDTPLGDEKAAQAAVDEYLLSWGAQDDPMYNGAGETMLKLVKWYQFVG